MSYLTQQEFENAFAAWNTSDEDVTPHCDSVIHEIRLRLYRALKIVKMTESVWINQVNPEAPTFDIKIHSNDIKDMNEDQILLHVIEKGSVPGIETWEISLIISVFQNTNPEHFLSKLKKHIIFIDD